MTSPKEYFALCCVMLVTPMHRNTHFLSQQKYNIFSTSHKFSSPITKSSSWTPVIINLLSFFVYVTCSWTRAQAGAMSGPWLYPGAETRSAHTAVANPAQAPVWSEAGAVLSIPGPRGPLPDIDKDDELLPPPQALRRQLSVHIFVSDNILNILVEFFWGTQLWFPVFGF